MGCSGSYPGPDSPASCYLIEADGPDGDPASGGSRTWRILVDLGNGALGALHRYVDPGSIDAVLISHLHADHCLDLCGYYVLRKYHPDGELPQIPVYGPAGIAARMARAYDLPEDPGMTEEFEFREYDASFAVGPFAIEPVAVDHPVEAFGLRISADGATIGYSGDTAPCAGVDRVAAGASLFLCEASFRADAPNPDGVHLTGVDAGEIATRGGAHRLVLTHIPPWYDAEDLGAEARTTFAGPIALARAGETYQV